MKAESIRDLLHAFTSSVNDMTIRQLSLHLDQIVAAISGLPEDLEPDDIYAPDGRPFRERYESLKNSYPSLGFYRVLDSVDVTMEEPVLIVGDSLDDLADIVSDFETTLWYFDNSPGQNALWHLQFQFKHHTEYHIRNLQYYLYRSYAE